MSPLTKGKNTSKIQLNVIARSSLSMLYSAFCLYIYTQRSAFYFLLLNNPTAEPTKINNQFSCGSYKQLLDIAKFTTVRCLYTFHIKSSSIVPTRWWATNQFFSSEIHENDKKQTINSLRPQWEDCSLLRQWMCFSEGSAMHSETLVHSCFLLHSLVSVSLS